MKRVGALALFLVTACTTAAVDTTGSTTPPKPAATSSAVATPPSTVPDPTSTTAPPPASPPPAYGPAPEVPEGPLEPTTEAALAAFAESIYVGDVDTSHLIEVVEGGDARVAWFLTDLLRFIQTGPVRDEIVWAFSHITDVPFGGTRSADFVWARNNLIAWDLPAWDGYVDFKEDLYTRIEDEWQVFFDEDHGVDWRLIDWGGVLADPRPLGTNGPCNCIPSLDNPALTDAAGGSWYADDGIVFGLVVNDEALALPIHQMQVHEMVNLTFAGRDLGIPYCTLCGSAQAYFTDNVPGVDRVVLRTSGLLSRSNKVMYDLTTSSVIDTFTGEALSGPLGAEGVVLEQTSVVASRWGDWKQAHPDTRILAEDGGIGRVYRLDPLGGRDDDGPIFAVGDVDPRLPVQEDVVGVLTAEGTAIAFPVRAMIEALESTAEISFEDVTVRLTDAIRVFDAEGKELTTHQSFWFAWSQFHPETLVWSQFG